MLSRAQKSTGFYDEVSKKQDEEGEEDEEDEENEENEEDKGSLKLKRKVGVSKGSADPFTKRTRLQGDEIEQPEAFVASDYAV